MAKAMATALRAAVMGIVCSFASWTPASAASPGPLEIYFIDVEGGQATLVVTPEKHTLLIDAGWASDGKGFSPGDPSKARDANRIVAAARDAGVSQIDYLLVTHFHTDHFGGASELAQLMPIRGFIDHGAPHPHASETSADTRNAFAVYSALRSKRTSAHRAQPRRSAAVRRRRGHGGEFRRRDVSAAVPGAGATNSACPKSRFRREIRTRTRAPPVSSCAHGKFRFLDVGDLSGQPLYDLVCPKNLVGRVEAYLTAHHGGADAAEPATFAALQPRVVMINNAPEKGGQRAMFEALHGASEMENVWQLHTFARRGGAQLPSRTIANVDDSDAHWIKLVAKEDGSFSGFERAHETVERVPGAIGLPGISLECGAG